ncbi:hypothetical protein FRC01_014635 [Tulasnella sp. 417]|nr:hypothetical protein FRC01_014635 [Tulasnella sp. 417]
MTYKYVNEIGYDMPWEILEVILYAWFRNKKLYRIDIVNKARSELTGKDGKTTKELKDGGAQLLQKRYGLRVIEKLVKLGRDRDDVPILMPEWDNPLEKHTRFTDQSQWPLFVGLETKGNLTSFSPAWRSIYAKWIPLLNNSPAERLRRERRERQMG